LLPGLPIYSILVDSVTVVSISVASVSVTMLVISISLKQVHSLCVDSRPVYYIVLEIVSVVFSIV